jgi:hypothetical protein
MSNFKKSTNVLLNIYRAGQKVRMASGISRTGNQEGILHETKDYSFVDDGIFFKK